MKDSYDPLDWGNSPNNNIPQHSADEYDAFANNPTYRSDFYDSSQEMDNTYQDSYQQDYQSFDNTYQQPQNTYSEQQMGNGPVQYSQADYDYRAQNPTYIEDPNRMSADEFFAMAHAQDMRDRQRENRAMYALTGRSRYLYGAATGDDSSEINKEVVLYLVFCALGAALSRLFNFPLWLYPMFSALVAYGLTLVKKIVIDNSEPKDAFKESVFQGIALAAGLIISLVLYSKGI
jgi:hypothetical protein